MDLPKLIRESNNRQTVEDMELLQRCSNYCGAVNILEIGSADGGSSVVLGDRARAHGGHLWCIEPKPKGRMKHNMTQYGLDGFYTIVPNASPWVPADAVPETIDLLFIDGCHELRWCLVDYHYFAPRVRPGGVIVFHDYGGQCAEDRRQADYDTPGYIGLVKRAVDIILETDKLREIDRSDALRGGAIAFEKP